MLAKFVMRYKAIKKTKNFIVLIFAIIVVSVILILHTFNSVAVSLPWYISTTNIDKFWNNGNTGTIALIDSGYNHELDDKIYKEQIVTEYNCYDLSTNVVDESGHGSNMVLLLIGKYKKNNIIGISPKSQIVVLKVTNETGSATEEAMLCAIEKAIGLITNLGIIGKDVVSSFKAFYKLCDKNALDAVFTQVMLYLPSYGISNIICDFVNNSLANIIPVLITYNLTMMTVDAATTAASITGVGIIIKAIKIAFDCYIQAHLPSVIQSAQILYQTGKYGKSTSIKIGWFTTNFEMV